MSTPASHDDRFFAAIYNRTARSRGFRKWMNPWRVELLREATGAVLEIGAGSGENFALYDPAVTTDVAAIEPNAHLLRHAQAAAERARVPIQLTQATIEKLPFPDAQFDTVVGTLVFCSVDVPLQGLREIARVLKLSGKLLLVEHVRNPRPGWGRVQDWLTPLQRRIAGNCHLNRATGDLVRQADFAILTETWDGGGIHPILKITAERSQ